MPILSRSRDGITQRTGEPSLRGGPAEKDPKGRTIRASRCIILGILVELTNVPRRNPVEFCDAGALQVLGERRQLLGVLPGCFRRQSAMRLHKQQIRRQNRGKPGWGYRRGANTSAKPPSLVCVEEDSDRGSETA